MQTHKKYKFIKWLRRRNEQRKKVILLIATMLLILAAGSIARGQEATLSPGEVLKIVREFHPVARITDNRIEQAKADITIARGGFDPLLYSSNAQKTFDGTTYYNYNRPELSIPTWFGISVEAGVEYLSGSRTDPQETIGRTSYAGISVPLAKNLLMDKRRAALQTAKIQQQASVAEKQAVLNDLLLEAMTAYWDWVKQYQLLDIATNAVFVNENRMRLIRIAVQQGERAAIDTVEAQMQLQQFQLMQLKARTDFINEGIRLSAYLWNQQGQPVNLPEYVQPDIQVLLTDPLTIPLPDRDSLLLAATEQHPELAGYRYKLQTLSVEKKLKFQELLPAVNFSYNQLGKGYDILKTATGSMFENNFRYGFTVGLPLRFSQGRGEYRKARLKIDETKMVIDQKAVLISNKVKSSYNELLLLREQAAILNIAVKNAETLQRGEETKLLNGESSLFLVNARENKTLEAKQKLLETRNKFMQKLVTASWSAGTLHSL